MYRGETVPGVVPKTCDSPPSLFAGGLFSTGTARFSKDYPPHAGNETPGPQVQNPGRTACLCRRARGRERLDHAQAGADVRHPQAACAAGDRHHRRRRRRSALRRLRLPALAGSELSARARRHLRLALADPPFRPAHRRHARRPYPQPEGRRALFRAAQGQHDQFRGAGKGPPQDQLRQPDAALSRRAAADGIRGSDQEGPVRARHRHRRADRQGPARADRVAAAHRQDGAAAEHRPFDHAQSSGMLPDRAADRRAARGSHRHAALGEGRGRVLDLRRAGFAPRRGRRNGDREGQAPGRASARRRDPARLRSPASAAPTTPWCRPPARC